MNLYQRIGYYIALIGCIAILIGMFFSRAINSIGLGMLILGSLPFILTKKTNSDNNNTFPPFILHLTALLFSLSLISYFWTSDTHQYWDKINTKIPYILLVLCYPLIIRLSKMHILSLLITYILSSTITGLISFLNYINHFDEINNLIIHSKPIPILFEKLSHIYYSFMLGFSILLNAWMLLYPIYQNKKLKILLLTTLILQLIIIHVIASRTGVFSFYFAVIITASIFAIQQKRTKEVILMSLILLMLVITAINFFPSWKNRIENTKVDLIQLKSRDNIDNYSLSMRFEALKIGYQLVKEKPFLGVGEGALQKEMEIKYQKNTPPISKENYTLPHNQFMQDACTTGLFAPILLLGLCFITFWTGIKKHHYVMLGFISLSFFAMQFESILERQAGITFFFLFLIIMHHPILKRNTNI